MNNISIANIILCFFGATYCCPVYASPSDIESRLDSLEKRIQVLEGKKERIVARFPIQGNQVEIPKEDFQKAYAQGLPSLLVQVREVPYFRDGAIVGSRLFAIRENSFFGLAGFANGDIITRVASAQVKSNSALTIIESLKAEGKVEVELERDRQTKTLSIRLGSSSQAPDKSNTNLLGR